MRSKDGYLESEEAIVTWCVGHLVTMSYPEVYDEKFRRWSFDTLPFLPTEFKYEVIESAKKQYTIVSSLLNRPDVTTIYVCTDSGREGEYIYRLVEQMSGVQDKERKRVWIDSQTEEEILRGIREAKDLSAYDNLGNAAYLRAKEDYLMGINFSRALTLKYGNTVKGYLKRDRAVISVGRVMTCVLGMIVNREREIRSFTKTPFYRVIGNFKLQEKPFTAEWRAVEGSKYYNSPALYKENGFKKKEDAERLIAELTNLLMHLKKGDSLTADTYEIKEGETSPPKRYTSGSIILTMENAGQFIEDEELRAQIKGSGIGTSATRAEILKKLVNIEYLALNKKTQVLTPTQMGEMIYDVVSDSIRPLLNPALTASWEKGLTMVADGVITPDEYMGKLTDFVGRRTTAVRSLNNQGVLWRQFQATEEFYQKKTKQSNAKNKE